MNTQPKWPSLLLLGVTSLAFSRILFASFNDSEGPNLLIVVVLAAILFAVPLIIQIPNSSIAASKRLVAAIVLQAVVVGVLYLLLR